MQEAGDGLPKHCVVSGEVNDRTGADGKHYAIGFEMRLPVEWNERFLHQVNGGNDGAVLPATGDQPKALASGGIPALAAASQFCRRIAGTPARTRSTSRWASAQGRPSASIRKPGATTATPRT
jgi:hypothetical protein